ncbi:hypothetical protein HK098_004009 [Nowakowskiella sp. JEL0407]|nr:hypothetical protein HK098_004009 [Nowakowskiella sp. JEL0407]
MEVSNKSDGAANTVTSINQPTNNQEKQSTTTQPILDDLDFDSYSDAELVSLVEDLTRTNSFLEQENKLFETNLLRVNPQALKNDGFDGREESKDVKDEVQDRLLGRREGKKKKGEKAKEIDKPILLTPEQKSEIATRELEELRDEIEKQKEEWSKVLDNYKAEMEEIEIRGQEIKKTMYEFKRDIEQQAVNPRTGKVIAERVQRYYEDKLRSKDAVIEKIRLKNATLKMQKNKLHLQLKQKEEMGEVLHAIDFDQLQIENKQYLGKIEERNSELLKLKMTAGNTVQILNLHKKNLQNLTQESERLRSEIAQRKDLLSKLKSEAELVNIEKKKAEKLNLHLREQMESFRVPEVMNYVQVKAQQTELQKKLKSWERKVEIAAMQTQRVKKIWQQMTTAA